jgi:pimeloyl-ACP methyl ester carboxylesterase
MRLPISGLTIAAAVLSAGCASHSNDLSTVGIDAARLPHPDTVIHIDGLVTCTGRADQVIFLNASEPVFVLVHGSNGTPGRLRGLAQVLADRGQQSVCFTYDDRAALADSSTGLASAIRQLTQKMMAEVTVLGHSQGALVARKAVTDDPRLPAPPANARLRLITVSGPFAGIYSARKCSSVRARVLSLGVVPLLCKILAGDKWTDISYNSDFIKNPGRLRPQVREHLKIDTDERDSCRKADSGQCTKSDYVFTLEEQHNKAIERNKVTQVVEIKAGHVEIVGDKWAGLPKLISTLQAKGLLPTREPAHAATTGRLLADNLRAE